MSLDVSLYVISPDEPETREAIFIRRDGSMVEICRAEWNELHPGREPVTTTIRVQGGERSEVYSRNITHNLGGMAKEAKVYLSIWRPEELGISRASELVESLTNGLALLRADPARFRLLNPPNGWGTYEGLVEFVDDYLDACRTYPEADVRAY